MSNKQFGRSFGKTQPFSNGIKYFKPEIGDAANVRLSRYKLFIVCLSSHHHKMKNTTLIFLLLICVGCTHYPPKIVVKVSLTDSNRAIKISGFDKAIIADIGRDTSGDAWESLLPVYKMPADPDLKDYQNVQPGKYKVADSVVVFTPDTLFKKGQSYFLRYYQHTEGVDAWQYIKDKKRPGSLSYKDLVFRY